MGGGGGVASGGGARYVDMRAGGVGNSGTAAVAAAAGGGGAGAAADSAAREAAAGMGAAASVGVMGLGPPNKPASRFLKALRSGADSSTAFWGALEGSGVPLDVPASLQHAASARLCAFRAFLAWIWAMRSEFILADSGDDAAATG